MNKKILHVVSSLDSGGVESMLKNYINNMNIQNIDFEFIVHGKKKGMLEDFFESKNCKIYHVTPKKKSLIKNFNEIYQIIKNGKYDVVHCHQNYLSFPTLIAARLNNVKIRIIHSHGCKYEKNILKRVYTKVLKQISILFANRYFACGTAAAKWLYGHNFNKKIYYMPNGVDINEFKFDNDIRNEYRKKMNIDNKKVILHVGRFSLEKNHKFIIDLVKLFKEKNKKDYKFILVGDGEEFTTIKDMIEKDLLGDYVELLGKRNDVSKLLSASDLFILPSKNEGFPVSVIECNVSGLDAICSNNISHEVNLIGSNSFNRLDTKEWFNVIIEKTNTEKDRKIDYNRIKKFDIKECAEKYLKYINEEVK